MKAACTKVWLVKHRYQARTPRLTAARTSTSTNGRTSQATAKRRSGHAQSGKNPARDPGEEHPVRGARAARRELRANREQRLQDLPEGKRDTDVLRGSHREVGCETSDVDANERQQSEPAEGHNHVGREKTNEDRDSLRGGVKQVARPIPLGGDVEEMIEQDRQRKQRHDHAIEQIEIGGEHPKRAGKSKSSRRRIE